MENRILILGSGGLIGRRTSDRFQNDINSQFLITGHKLDLNEIGKSIESIFDLEPTLIIQLAWSASSTPDYRNDAANFEWAEFTKLLAYSCVSKNIDFIGIGSGVEIDSSNNDSYTVGKKLAFKAIEQLVTGELITWARLGFVFDPVSKSPALLREILEALDNARPANVSEPNSAHDFIHVDDVADALYRIAVSGKKGLFEIGGGRKHLVRDVAEALGYVDTSWGDTKPSKESHQMNISRVKELGWNASATKQFFEKT